MMPCDASMTASMRAPIEALTEQRKLDPTRSGETTVVCSDGQLENGKARGKLWQIGKLWQETGSTKLAPSGTLGCSPGPSNGVQD